jgi:hypothetical protein
MRKKARMAMISAAPRETLNAMASVLFETP